jgi:hypothetical protein
MLINLEESPIHRLSNFCPLDGGCSYRKPHHFFALLAFFVLVLLLFWAPVATRAQRVIYNQTNDQTAQGAATAAKDIGAGTLFQKMLHNVDLQSKQEADTTMSWVEQQMRAKIENFEVWSSPKDKVASPMPQNVGIMPGRCFSIKCELLSLEVRLNFFLGETQVTPDQIQKSLADLDQKKKQLDDALKQLQASSKSQEPTVLRAFTLLQDNGKDVIDYAKEIAKLAEDQKLPAQSVSASLAKISDGMDQILTLYGVIKGIWEGQQAISVDPASLRPSSQQIDLELLALEQDHLRTIMLILARENIEAGAALNRVTTALNRMEEAGLSNSPARVEDTLRAAVENHDRQRIRMILDALHEAAAAVASEDAAGRLAALRLSDEERRYSIGRSAVNSSVYDQTILAASQRLALYWKSGMKPSELAQLVFYITNTAGVSVIAAKQ